MNRTAALTRVSVIGLTIALVVVGGMGVYYYTSPPGSSGASNTAGPTSSNVIKVLGNQGSDGYIAVQFNGTTYQAAPKGPNSPSFPCPVGTDPSLCGLLQQTCGNGVGPSQEPWKNCTNCVFDAGCNGAQACDPYTHQCSVFASACQVAVYGGA